jgi:hypothetical protein
MPFWPAALIVAEPVVLDSADLGDCATRLGLGPAGSLSAVPLPQPSEATFDCTSVSGAGPAAQFAKNAQKREITTKRMDTRKPPAANQRYHRRAALSPVLDRA